MIDALLPARARGTDTAGPEPGSILRGRVERPPQLGDTTVAVTLDAVGPRVFAARFPAGASTPSAGDLALVAFDDATDPWLVATWQA